MEDLPPTYIAKKPKGMSCFAKGCVVIAALFALLFVAAWGVGFYFQRSLGPFVSQQQVPLRANTTINEQYQAALRKLQPLVGMDPSDQTTPASHPPILLTAADLNALVAHDPRLAGARGKCFFTLPGKQLAVDVSTDFSQQQPSSRRQIYYVNARVTCNVDVSNGVVRLDPDKVESLSGKPFPAWLMNNSVFKAMLDGWNKGVNDDIRNNTDLADLVSKIGSARVEDSHLILTLVNPPLATRPGASPVAVPTP